MEKYFNRLILCNWITFGCKEEFDFRIKRSVLAFFGVFRLLENRWKNRRILFFGWTLQSKCSFQSDLEGQNQACRYRPKKKFTFRRRKTTTSVWKNSTDLKLDQDFEKTLYQSKTQVQKPCLQKRPWLKNKDLQLRKKITGFCRKQVFSPFLEVWHYQNPDGKKLKKELTLNCLFECLVFVWEVTKELRGVITENFRYDYRDESVLTTFYGSFGMKTRSGGDRNKRSPIMVQARLFSIEKILEEIKPKVREKSHFK